MNSVRIHTILLLGLFLLGFSPAKTRAQSFTVITVADTGTGSLRWAIGQANLSAGPDTIRFDIPKTSIGHDGTIWRIRPKSSFPDLTDGGTLVDGTTQTVNQGETNPYGPEIIVDGKDIPGVGIGFSMNSSDNEIRGLVVSAFKQYGIRIEGSGTRGNRIRGNYIGTNGSGNDTLSNYFGILICDRASSNVIGGPDSLDHNLISGNLSNGVCIQNADSNWVTGNAIGTDVTGTVSLENGMDGSNGVRIADSAKYNTIGGSGPNQGNLISGNHRDGIHISAADSNRVIGNYIGTDWTGMAALGNGVGGSGDGIDIRFNSRGNDIGGSGPGEGNVVSANRSVGVRIHSEGSDGNRVLGNRIGTDAVGTGSLGNGLDGVMVYEGASGNWVGSSETGGSNIISANLVNGITLEGTGTDSNWVEGNRIGTDSEGLQDLGNGQDGIFIFNGTRGNQIGPDNRVAFNRCYGIRVEGPSTLYNRITRNSVTKNTGKGIALVDGGNREVQPPELAGSGSLEGTTFPNARVEVYSDESDEGEYFEGEVRADSGGRFSWNLPPSGLWFSAIASDDSGNTSEFSSSAWSGSLRVTLTADSGSGSLRWALQQAEVHSGPDTIRFDIPDSDPGFDGSVWWIRPQTSLPIFSEGGTCILGSSQEANRGDRNTGGPDVGLDGRSETDGEGIRIASSSNTVSGMIVSGFGKHGIQIAGTGTSNNRIKGCWVGTDASGQDTIPNGTGISLILGTMANIIGGPETGDGNVVSGNGFDGIHISDSDSNTVVGCLVGTDRTGTMALPNDGEGIDVRDGSKANRIGGSGPSEGNVVSGNGSSGISLNGSGTSGNIVAGNLIGTDATGTAALGNRLDGLSLFNGTSSNRIGEAGAAGLDGGNVISGNGEQGITIEGLGTDKNVIEGNRIGLDKSGSGNLGNGISGIRIAGSAKSDSIGPGNRIAANAAWGVHISDSTVSGIAILENSISGNGGGGIFLATGSNGNEAPPLIENSNPISGTAPPLSRVDIYSDSLDQGELFEAFTFADASGGWSWTGSVRGPHLTATATDTMGNTSAFSDPLVVTAIGLRPKDVPKRSFLAPNYPNPFNSSTLIRFGIKAKTRVRLSVFNMLGREIAVLADGILLSGEHERRFDAEELPSGVYFIRLETEGFRALSKCVLVE